MPSAEAYRRAAHLLANVAGERHRLVVTAQDGWRGPHRDAFDEEDTVLHRRADEITECLLITAATLDAGPQCAPS